VNTTIDKGGKVLIEGTQGFGLSVYHSPHYPFATSRDTTASGFLSEVGVSPRLVTDIVMAVRSYPIRVAGHSGPLPSEITWDEVRKRSGCPHAIIELTTTTKKVRRIALFDLQIVQKAALVNRPTQIFLHGADYLSWNNKSLCDYERLTSDTKSFAKRLNLSLGVPVTLIGTGPANEELIDSGT
jgi:adenylosuccinate synthase